MMTTQAAARALQAECWGEDKSFERVSTDSRAIMPGDLFIALGGDTFDGHDFVAEVMEKGAAAALVQMDWARKNPQPRLPLILVENTRLALGHLAAYWRGLFQIPLVAVTGSNGKTTVTQMIASIFRAWVGDAAFATEGNFNNDIGLPLTLLRLRAQHRAAVVELGMNHPGEIGRLAAIAKPTVALVNNAQREHLEFMATVEAVARENGTAIAALGDDGIAVFPADDAHAAIWREIAGARRTITFALHEPADVSGSAVWHGDHWVVAMQTPAGAASFSLGLGGTHNVRNALAASAAALAAGSSLEAIVRGLESFVAVRGR